MTLDNLDNSDSQTKTNKGSIGYFLMGFVLAAVIFAIGVGAYFLGRKGVTNNNRTPNPIEKIVLTVTPTPTPSQTSKNQILTKEEVMAKVIAAANSKDFSILSDLANDQVSLLLQASECCGTMPKAEAIDQINSYLKSANGPWNFDQSNSTMVSIKAAYPETYKDIVGIAANEYVIGVNLDENNKITGVSLSVSYKLLVS